MLLLQHMIQLSFKFLEILPNNFNSPILQLLDLLLQNIAILPLYTHLTLNSCPPCPYLLYIVIQLLLYIYYYLFNGLEITICLAGFVEDAVVDDAVGTHWKLAGFWLAVVGYVFVYMVCAFQFGIVLFLFLLLII